MLADMAEQAARLCKADLVTGMVGEFPELQGIMGGYYARAEGLPDEVADAIRDHYKPVGQGDDVPTAPVTVAVSLADKLDTLICFFVFDELPNGSKDPFALRRASLAVISLILKNSIRVNLRSLFKCHAQLLYRGAEVHDGHFRATLNRIVLDNNSDPASVRIEAADLGSRVGIRTNNYYALMGGWYQSFAYWAVEYVRVFLISEGRTLVSFFADRLKVQQREAGVRHDLIDAVFALGEDDLVRLLARVKALQGFVGSEDGVNLLAGYKRAANILRKEGFEAATSAPPAGPQGAGPPEAPAETALRAALDAAEPRAAAAIEAEDFERAMAALATLRAPIDGFFEQVTVVDPDPALRAARLGLLARVRDAVHRVADFSKIEG